MTTIYDVAVVGAGPAGLVAATVAAQHALATIVFDEQPDLGGPQRREQGGMLIDAFRQSGATGVVDATVWSARKRDDGTYEFCVSYGAAAARSSRVVIARAVILATGALERPFPIPGCTLPGVMTADAAQNLLASPGAFAQRRVVLAGTGPVIWSLASRYLHAGMNLEALLDTTPRGRRWAALPKAFDFLRSPYVGRSVATMRDVRRNTRVVANVTELAASGRSQLESVSYVAAGGTHVQRADHLVLHQGFVPDINFGSAMGAAHCWSEATACFEPVVDMWGGSTLPGVFFAGDAAGIASEDAAQARGHLAALAVANALGRIDARARDSAAQAPRAALRRALRGRAFLDALHRPSDAYRVPQGDSIFCRCEEVTAQQVVDAVRIGCVGPNQVKAFLRCGMGPCQGRLCGLTVTELIARERKVAPDVVGYFRIRYPVKPITLGELASLPASPEAERAVGHIASHG